MNIKRDLGSLTTRQKSILKGTGTFPAENRLEALPACFPQYEKGQLRGKPGTKCTSPQWGHILAVAPRSTKGLLCYQEIACTASNTQIHTEVIHTYYLLQQFSCLLLRQAGHVPWMTPKPCQMFSPALVMRSGKLVASTTCKYPPSAMHLLQTSKLPNNTSGTSVLRLSTKSQNLVPHSWWERIPSTCHDLPSSLQPLLLLHPRRDETETVPSMSQQRGEGDMKH